MNSQVAMTTIGTPPNGLPLGNPGDFCLRSDNNTNWIFNGTDQPMIANWVELLAASAPVQSVAGRVGNVVLSASDISGLAPSATIDTTNAVNISTGTLNNARTTATPTSTGNTIVSSDNNGNFSAEQSPPLYLEMQPLLQLL